MPMKYISTILYIPIFLVFPQAKAKMRIDGDTLEDFYERAHLDETRRKFLDGLRQGREELDTIPVQEKYTVMKKEISWRLEFVKKREIRPDSSLRI
jgi:hypothetical protein